MKLLAGVKRCGDAKVVAPKPAKAQRREAACELKINKPIELEAVCLPQGFFVDNNPARGTPARGGRS